MFGRGGYFIVLERPWGTVHNDAVSKNNFSLYYAVAGGWREVVGALKTGSTP